MFFAGVCLTASGIAASFRNGWRPETCCVRAVGKQTYTFWLNWRGALVDRIQSLGIAALQARWRWALRPLTAPGQWNRDPQAAKSTRSGMRRQFRKLLSILLKTTFASSNPPDPGR